MRIRLYVVSTDERLIRQCREVIRAHFENSVELVRSDDTGVTDPEGIYFLDVSSAEREIAFAGLDHGRCFAFIATPDLPRFTEALLTSRLTVVVKPVPGPRLTQAIAQAIKQYGEKEPAAGSPRTREANVILQALLEANMNLQIYDQDRTRFLSRALHDFRTPLTSLSGYCGLLIENQLGPLSQSQAKVIERMQRTINRLSQLTDGLFQLSLGGHAVRRSQSVTADIGECIEQAVHELMPSFKQKNLVIHLEVSPPDYELKFDTTQIEQVLVNLLDNAYKFSSRGGLIEIRAYPYFWNREKSEWLGEDAGAANFESNAFRIEIQDSGPGIREDVIDHIFEEYLTVSSEDGRSGAGLGLAICKLIINLHGGVIGAESRGRGATFSIVLPYAALPHQTIAGQTIAGQSIAATMNTSDAPELQAQR